MMDIYLKEMSAFTDIESDGESRLTYSHLNSYWESDSRNPYFIYVGGNVVGFVLVNDHTETEGADWSIAEFFVVNKYRRQGLGKRAAFEVFNLFSGLWEVTVLSRNIKAQRFWHHTISQYSVDQYKLLANGENGGDHPVFLVTGKQK